MDAISLNNGCIQPHLIAARETRLESAAQNLRLYFEQGAKEVWICDEYGNMSFYSPKRKLVKSKMFAEFPNKVEI